MNLHLIAAVSFLAIPLCAQNAELRAPDLNGLDLRVEQSTAKLSAPAAADKFFGVLLGATSAKTITFPGLPSLLATTLVIGAGWTQGAMSFDLGKLPAQAAAYGVEVFLQGVGQMNDKIVASNIATIGSVAKN